MSTRGNAEYPCAVDGCGLQAHERRICGVCTGNLERDLAEMPALLSDLSVTLSRQARIGGRNGSRSREVPLPYDPRASEALYILRSTLNGWAEAIRNETEHLPPHLAHRLAPWLYARRHRLFDHPEAEKAVDEIRAAVRNGWHVVDRPLPRIYAGICMVDGCDRALYAKPMQIDIDCPSCGIRHSVAERRQIMLDELDARLCTIAEIVNLGVYLGTGMERKRTRNLLDKWVERGRITPHGLDSDGHPLYPFGDTVRLVLATPQRLTVVA